MDIWFPGALTQFIMMGRAVISSFTVLYSVCGIEWQQLKLCNPVPVADPEGFQGFHRNPLLKLISKTVKLRLCMYNRALRPRCCNFITNNATIMQYVRSESRLLRELAMTFFFLFLFIYFYPFSLGHVLSCSQVLRNMYVWR